MAQAFVDTFNRADGNLAGSALSGGVGTWLEPDGLAWQIISNMASTGTELTTGALARAMIDTATDNDDLFIEVDLTFTRPSSELIWRLYIGCSDDLSVGYYAQYKEETGFNEFFIRKLDGAVNIVDPFSPTDPIPNDGRLRFERIGGVFALTVDGVDLFTPISDSSGHGSSNRKVGFGAIWNDQGPGVVGTVAFDNLEAGDAVAVGGGSPRNLLLMGVG